MHGHAVVFSHHVRIWFNILFSWSKKWNLWDRKKACECVTVRLCEVSVLFAIVNFRGEREEIFVVIIMCVDIQCGCQNMSWWSDERKYIYYSVKLKMTQYWSVHRRNVKLWLHCACGATTQHPVCVFSTKK